MSRGEKTPVLSAMASSAGVSSGMVGRIMVQPFPARPAGPYNEGKRPLALLLLPIREFTMTATGWKRLLEGWPWFQGEGSYPIFPNSEYMPPIRLVRKPYGTEE